MPPPKSYLLQDKLGSLLYQLLPNMKRNDEVLETLLSLPPERFQHVFEFRHEPWLDDAVFQALGL